MQPVIPQAPAPIASVTPVVPPVAKPIVVAPIPAPITSPTLNKSPVVKYDDFVRMRESQTDKDIAHNLYHTDPAFKAQIDKGMGYVNKQTQDWRDTQFPTVALDYYYKSQKQDVMISKGMQEVMKTVAQPPKPSPFSPIGDVAKLATSIGSGMAGDIQDAGVQVNKDFNSDTLTPDGKPMNALGQGANMGADLLGGLTKTLVEPLKPIVEPIAQILGKLFQAHNINGSDSFNPLTKDGGGEKSPDIQQTATQFWQHMESEHPNVAAGLKAALAVPSMALAGSGISGGLNATEEGVNALGDAAASKMTGEANLGSLVKQYGSVDDIPLDKIDPNELARVQSLSPEDLKNEINASSAGSPEVSDLPEHAVQPKLSSADLKKMAATPAGAKALKEGSNATGTFRNSMGPELSSGEKDLHELAKTIPGYGEGEGAVAADKAMTPDAALHNASVTGQQIADESKTLDESLAKNNFLVPNTESEATVNKALDAAVKEAPEESKAYENAKNIWSRIRSGFPGNAVGEREARKAFDSYIDKKWSNIWGKGTPQADALRTVREASSGLIQKYALQNGLDYTAQLKRLSGMYDLMDNLSSHVTPDVFKSTVSRLLSKPIVKAAAHGLGVGTAVNAAEHLLPITKS